MEYYDDSLIEATFRAIAFASLRRRFSLGFS